MILIKLSLLIILSGLFAGCASERYVTDDHTAISQARPGEYRFVDFFQKTSAVFFARLVKSAREYGEGLQKQIVFFAGPRNKLRWDTHVASAEEIVYISEHDEYKDFENWFINPITIDEGII